MGLELRYRTTDKEYRKRFSILVRIDGVGTLYAIVKVLIRET